MTFDLSVTFVRPWRFAPSLTLEAMSFVMSPRAATFSTKPPTLGHNSIAIYQITCHWNKSARKFIYKNNVLLIFGSA